MSNSTEQTKALTLPERAAIALGAAQHEANLLALAKKHTDIVAIKNQAGREQCHGAMMQLAKARIAITKSGKEARDDANAFSKAVIAEEKRLIAIIEPEEERLRGLRDGWDAEREREKQAKAQAERERIETIRARIEGFMLNAVRVASQSPDVIAHMQKQISETAITIDDFAEFTGEAQAKRDETVQWLQERHAEAVAREAEAARLAAEREELERLRREEAERQAAAAAARAEEEHRLAAKREAQEAQLRAEREAHERQLADERAEADRIAREKLAAEEAELRAQREAQEAEARRLAEERVALERQQREAQEQRQREEAARAAVAAAAEEQMRRAAPMLLAACRAALTECPDLNCAAQLRAAIDAAEVVDADFEEAA